MDGIVSDLNLDDFLRLDCYLWLDLLLAWLSLGFGIKLCAILKEGYDVR